MFRLLSRDIEGKEGTGGDMRGDCLDFVGKRKKDRRVVRFFEFVESGSES